MKRGARTTALLAVAGFLICTVLRATPPSQSSPAESVDSFGELSRMVVLGDFTSKRASSWNPTGQNRDFCLIPAGGTRVLLEEKGAGTIDHFYWTYIEKDEKKRERLFRGLVLRAYWDGVPTPAIEVPLGDFFGVGNGQIRAINSLAFVTNPGESKTADTWGFNCYLPMPFANGARIEIENQSSEQTRIWFHIDYRLFSDPAAIPLQVGRLHSAWHREAKTVGVPFHKGTDPLNLVNRWKIENLSGKENYVVLDTEGDGQFVGYFLTVVNLKGDPWTWWGEGDDMIFIDGEGFPPSFHGTGSEEIFGGGACPAVEFAGPYTGFHCVENWGGEKWLGTNGMYRFHVNDPIRFRKAIRVTLEHGHGNNKFNDYSSVAFWYQKGVNPKRSLLPPFAERLFRTDYLGAPPWMDEKESSPKKTDP